VDSYELRRRQLYSNRVGMTIGIDGLHSKELDVYSGGPDVEEYFRRETAAAIGDIPDFTAVSFSVGRSSGGVVALLAVGVSLYSIIAQAKDLSESIPVIKKWAHALNEWRKRFLPHTEGSFTVEALKVFAIADLHERFGSDTEPCVGLIMTNAGSVRAVDGMLRPFGPVYMFIPDKLRNVTHLYAMAASGEIQHRTEIPGFGVTDILATADQSLLLEVPAREKDPTLGDDGMPRTLANRILPGSLDDPTLHVPDVRTQAVLVEILDQQRPYVEGESEIGREMSPAFAQLTQLASLLASDVHEEELQRFLGEHPEFLLGFVPRSAGIELAFLVKPPIGTQYRADFAILTTGQGGSRMYLFELEPSTAKLFTQPLTEADTLRRSLGQIRDWQQWIAENKATFTRDMLRLAREAPQYPERSHNGSFRLYDGDRLMNMWGGEFGYGSFDEPGASYTIIIGRWANLTSDERKRLVFLNRERSSGAQILTYDQVARAAYHRPHRGFHDEDD
jgi:hypothetical protein